MNPCREGIMDGHFIFPSNKSFILFSKYVPIPIKMGLLRLHWAWSTNSEHFLKSAAAQFGPLQSAPLGSRNPASELQQSGSSPFILPDAGGWMEDGFLTAMNSSESHPDTSKPASVKTD